MSLQHDIAKRARRRAAAERSRDRREATHLTIDQARVAWWFVSRHRRPMTSTEAAFWSAP